MRSPTPESYAGFRYRSSTSVGWEMGQQIGE